MVLSCGGSRLGTRGVSSDLMSSVSWLSLSFALLAAPVDQAYAQTACTTPSNAATCTGPVNLTGGTFINSGSIQNDVTGVYISSSPLTTLTNSSTGYIRGINYGIKNDGTNTNLTNDGTIFSLNLSAILNGGTINSLQNNISGKIAGSSAGIKNSGYIANLTNIGRIIGSSGIGIKNSGEIFSLTNTGVISGYSGINNSGVIDTLINGQGGTGGGGTINPLSYSGELPTSYQEYIFSNDHYGQINFSAGVSGTMDFSVALGSNTGVGSIYSSVLIGISASQIGGSISGTLTSCGTISAQCFQGSSNGYTWDLYQAGLPNTWDLLITGAMSAPELDGSLVPRVLLLLFIAYLLSGGQWPVRARHRTGE